MIYWPPLCVSVRGQRKFGPLLWNPIYIVYVTDNIDRQKKIKAGVDETEEGDDDFSDDELEFEGGDIIDELEKQKDFDKSDMMSLASLDEDEMTSPEAIKEHKKSKLKSLLQSVETIRNQKTKEKKVYYI